MDDFKIALNELKTRYAESIAVADDSIKALWRITDPTCQINDASYGDAVTSEGSAYLWGTQREALEQAQTWEQAWLDNPPGLDGEEEQYLAALSPYRVERIDDLDLPDDIDLRSLMENRNV